MFGRGVSEPIETATVALGGLLSDRTGPVLSGGDKRIPVHELRGVIQARPLTPWGGAEPGGRQVLSSL